MKFKTLVLILITLNYFNYSFAQKERKVAKYYLDNTPFLTGQEVKIDDEWVKKGEWKMYYQNGKLKFSGNFTGGYTGNHEIDAMIGECTYYYPNGNKAISLFYKKENRLLLTTTSLEKVKFYWWNGKINRIVNYINSEESLIKKRIDTIKTGNNGKYWVGETRIKVPERKYLEGPEGLFEIALVEHSVLYEKSEDEFKEHMKMLLTYGLITAEEIKVKWQEIEEFRMKKDYSEINSMEYASSSLGLSYPPYYIWKFHSEDGTVIGQRKYTPSAPNGEYFKSGIQE